MSIRTAIARLFRQSWPVDWRERMAKGDAKALRFLKAFETPEDMLQSHRLLRAEYTRLTQTLAAMKQEQKDTYTIAM